MLRVQSNNSIFPRPLAQRNYISVSHHIYYPTPTKIESRLQCVLHLFPGLYYSTPSKRCQSLWNPTKLNIYYWVLLFQCFTFFSQLFLCKKSVNLRSFAHFSGRCYAPNMSQLWRNWPELARPLILLPAVQLGPEIRPYEKAIGLIFLFYPTNRRGWDTQVSIEQILVGFNWSPWDQFSSLWK